MIKTTNSTYKSNLTEAQRELLEKRLRGRTTRQSQAPTISRRKIHENIPQSFAQQRLWFMDQFEPGRANFHIPFAVRMIGRLEVGSLERSFNRILRRHEALRTTFGQVDGTPVQIIKDSAEIDIEKVDLRGLSKIEQEARTRLILKERTAEPFNLEQWPLMRVSLLRLAESEHVLLVVMHHIISDGWSVGLFWRELSLFYKGNVRGEETRLPDLDIQYPDYACWQREPEEIERIKKGVEHWKKGLQEAATLLELPTDRPRPAVRTTAGAIQRHRYSLDLMNRLREVCHKEGVTMSMLLLSAFKALLFQCSWQEDILVGIGIANRNLVETECLIGFFVNMLVIRSDLSGNPTFRELLDRIKQQSLNAYAYQDVPFEKIVEALQPERNLSHTPIFQAVFVLQNTPMKYELDGLELTDLEIETSTANYDLTLSMMETEVGLLAKLEYNLDLFDETTIRRMNKHLEAILWSASKNLDQRLMDLHTLREEEQHQLVVEWNDTDTEIPQECLFESIESEARNRPEAIAVECGDRMITFGELNRRANQLAYWLRGRGVRPESRVAVAMEPGIELVIAQLSVMKAGGAFVPLDVGYPDERLRYMLQNAEVAVIITDGRLKMRLGQVGIEVLSYDDEGISQIAGESTENPGIPVNSGHSAYLIYTSGSTGRPKGVVIIHRGLTNILSWYRSEFGVGNKDRGSQLAGVGFDASILEIWMCLGSGASISIVDRDTRANPLELRRWLVSREITVCFLPPVMVEEVLWQERWESKSLRVVLTGGDRLSHYGRDASSSELVNLYGPTESTIVTSYGRVEAKADAADGPPPIGSGISNCSVYILDREMGLVPIGVKGEICVAGEVLARGYFGNAQATAEKFIPNLYGRTPGGRMYRTGDLARYLSDGRIEFIGRADQQVKIRGYRIELGEIEAVLVEHEKVREAVVIVDDSPNGDKKLRAAVVGKEEELSSGELRNYLKQRLPEYMVPASIRVMEALPITANGKIDRKALLAQEWGTNIEETYEAPRTPTEEALAEIWMEVLQIDRVGINDRFFDIGGHSLLATKLVTRIKYCFEIPFTLPTLFEKTTIAEQAEVIEEELIKEIVSL